MGWRKNAMGGCDLTRNHSRVLGASATGALDKCCATVPSVSAYWDTSSSKYPIANPTLLTLIWDKVRGILRYLRGLPKVTQR